jgi:pyruvate/2-oxoglutarate dehydrogenase complex dihydrolipoamide acyltransferase (E2) component
MTVRVTLPKWAMGIEEGMVARWLKAKGDKVEKGEPIAEIETAKAMEELQAPTSGTLVEILVGEGETAAVNADIAVIEEHHD